MRRMEEEFRKKIDAVSELAIEAKKKDKIEKHAKVLEALEKCKEHSGPLTATDLPNLHLKRKEGKNMIDFAVDLGNQTKLR